MTNDTELRAADFARVETNVGGWPAGVTTWRLGERWMCRIDNVDPGATVARGQGTSKDEAIAAAMQRATGRMARTRRFSTGG